MPAEAFLGPRPSPKHDTNHKDGDKTNNRVSNLEWCSKSENQSHAYAIGLRIPMGGERNGKAKLSLKDVLRLRDLAKNMTRHELSEKFGLTVGAVDKILGALAWRNHLSEAVSAKRADAWVKLTASDINSMRSLAQELTRRQLSERFGISLSSVDRHLHDGGVSPKSPMRHGVFNGNALLVEADAVRILKLKGSMPQKTLAAQFGVDVQVVQRIHQRTTWRHLDATG